MTTLREAAQQALETLEMLAQPTKTNSETPRYKAHKAAITALRTALAQQDEPKGGGNLPPPLQAELAAEREACAKECDAVSASADKAAVDGQYLVIRNGAEARRCAAAIRARSNA
jgi:hypothetical protein